VLAYTQHWCSCVHMLDGLLTCGQHRHVRYEHLIMSWAAPSTDDDDDAAAHSCAEQCSTVPAVLLSRVA
jgi:hypothetical protein